MGRLGLDPGAEWVLNHLEGKFGSLIIWPESAGYRAEQNIPSASRTEHFTRDAVDLQFPNGDWARAEKALNYCILNRRKLGLEALIWNNTQWGYESYGYSSWDRPQRQWWQPPAGWQKDGDFGISDPFHQRHIHLKVLNSFIPKEGAPGKGESAAEVIDNYFAGNYYQYGPYESVGQIILEEAEENIDPALACALVEKESGGRNVFGCDWGSQWAGQSPWCNERVTRPRLDALLADIESGYGSNGVGLTQLTHPPFIHEAESMGGAHVPRYQCRVGFRLLRDLILKLGYTAGLAAYNAGEGNWQLGINNGYAGDLAYKHGLWKERLAGAAVEPPKPKPEARCNLTILNLRPKHAQNIAKAHRKHGREVVIEDVGVGKPVNRKEPEVPPEPQNPPVGPDSPGPGDKGPRDQGTVLRPGRKVSAATVGGAVSTIALYILAAYGIEAEPEVGAAVATIVSLLLGYLVPEGK